MLSFGGIGDRNYAELISLFPVRARFVSQTCLCLLLCARAAIAKDTMGLESEQVCPAARVLQDIMSNEQAENDPFLYLDPHPRVSALRLH
jgi:hypothetical protein